MATWLPTTVASCARRRNLTIILNFAKAVYDWQKKHLLRPDGVYDDMMGGYDSPDIKYVTIDGERYRTGSKLRDRVGPAITYNSGTMLSGAADLFRVTSDADLSDGLGGIDR